MRSNAKNSFGGYEGLTTHTVLIYDNGAPPLAQEPTIYDGCNSRYFVTAHELDKDYKPSPPAATPQAKSPKRNAI